MWTWEKGSDVGTQSAAYGTKGVSNTTNTPSSGNQAGASASISQAWVFGGYGISNSNIYALLNELWQFDGTNWIFMSGANGGSSGIYGVLNVPDPTNIPGTRRNPCVWAGTGGKVWLFGGWGYDGGSSSQDYMNDMWTFDGGNWTWVRGPDTSGGFGVFGIQGVADANNIPSPRGSAAHWVDNMGQLWLFGGNGYDNSSAVAPVLLGDVWNFNGQNWTWVAGPAISAGYYGVDPVYGTKGVGKLTNQPGGRSQAASWVDAQSRLWIFGGQGTDSAGNLGRLDDLWVFQQTGCWSANTGGSTITGTTVTTSTSGTGQIILSGAESPSSSGVSMAANIVLRALFVPFALLFI